MMQSYRKLTDNEIAALISNGCRAKDWANITVGNGFDASCLIGCTFDGMISIGATGGELEIGTGIKVNSGIYSAHIIDTNIGDDCYINNISEYISNQQIGDRVIINGASRIEADKDNTFGNGTLVETINEGGGRGVAISDKLTAQTAYMVAMYRHRPKMVEAYENMVSQYTNSIRSEKGIIESDARISGVKIIKNSRIAQKVEIEASNLLNNCTIHSSSYIGFGVSIEHSIVLSYSCIDSSTMLSHCFVGGAVKLSKSFFGEHSLFFSGSDLALGEACAIFAGPFTVSHHRSTLLIAGMFSFFNAGSGANQSNHLYRTGPVHQGIHRRGVKFGSNAYVLSPALTGAFTLLSGNHKSNHDTEHFPFSYLIEEEGKSYLMPASNIRSFGTARDCKKWQNRDKRTAENRDIINFEKFSPSIIQNIVEGINISEQLLEKPNSSGVYTYNRVKIKETMLRHGIKLYKMAISIFLSEALSLEDQAIDYSGAWVDMAGMIAPKELVDDTIDGIESGSIDNLDKLYQSLCEIDSKHHNYTRGWALNLAAKMLGTTPEAVTPEQIEELIIQGQKDAENLEHILAEDAKKDSAIVMSTGYGIDHDSHIRQQEFLNIRAEQAK